MIQSNGILSLPSVWSKGESLFISSVGISAFLLIFCIASFAGCTTDTGTKTAMNIGALYKIDNLEVQVFADKDFSVVLAGEEVNGYDVLFAIHGGTLVGTCC
jgi:hypothetical protein